MRVDDLIPTQDGFRLPVQTRERMVEFVRRGGIYDLESIAAHSGQRRLIAIDRFPDGRCFVRDGIHRVISIYLARSGRCLCAGEYHVSERDYSTYSEIDIADGWYAPFDPREEVRLADFTAFRTEVLQQVLQGSDPIGFIRVNRRMYSRARTDADTIEQLARSWTLQCVT